MDDYRLAKLTRSGIPAFEALFVAILRELHSDNLAAFENYRKQYTAERLEKLLDDANFCLMAAWQGSTLAGFGIGYVSGGVGLLHWMGVEASHRRTTLGLRLGERMVQALWALKCHKLTLYTYAAIPWLTRFYKTLGFYEIARIDNFYFKLDIVYMGNDKPQYALNDLLAGMTEENKHEETDWGPAVGKEIWQYVKKLDVCKN